MISVSHLPLQSECKALNVPSPCLELRGVSKGYGPPERRTEVLANVNLRVARGEFVAIVGRSGSGKTTLVSLVAGLLTPDLGAVRVNGRDVDGPGPDRGVVFQNYSLLPWLNVLGNVQLAVDQVRPEWSPDERRKWAEKYIALVNLKAASGKLPRELSGGMRQRVAVARALAMNPDVLLLDEPLGALDALTRGTLQDELQRICQNERKTVLLITNDVDEGLLLADRMIVMTAGPQATLGPEFVIDVPHPRTHHELNHNPELLRLRREISAFLSGCGRKPTVVPPTRVPMPDIAISARVGVSA
jgi:nitrate/nitrite transport system ATP-binding protein